MYRISYSSFQMLKNLANQFFSLKAKSSNLVISENAKLLMNNFGEFLKIKASVYVADTSFLHEFTELLIKKDYAKLLTLYGEFVYSDHKTGFSEIVNACEKKLAPHIDKVPKSELDEIRMTIKKYLSAMKLIYEKSAPQFTYCDVIDG